MKAKASSSKSSRTAPGGAIKSILVPVDFSPPSDNALRQAASLAGRFGAKLTLVHVLQPIVAPEAIAVLAVDDDEAVRAARKRIESTCRGLRIVPRLVEKVLIRTGVPFHEICQAAKSRKVDWIIIATHGHTGLKHVLLGSTAERVVRHAGCPVLVVRQRG